jgi:hypothetical protein
MHKLSRKKLTLAKHTIATLTTSELTFAAGGIISVGGVSICIDCPITKPLTRCC